MAFLLDSNIIIYSYSVGYEYLRELILNDESRVSEITRLEVLGYHGLNVDEEQYFKHVFSYIPVIVPDQDIYDRAILLKKKYKMKLGDSLIAATAIVQGLEIYTRNVSDFKQIKEAKCINPVRG